MVPPLTTAAYLSSRTAMPEHSFLRPDYVLLRNSEWTSADRRKLHEDYWGRFLYDYLSEIPESAAFDEAWASLQYHEFLKGSGEGSRFLRRVTGWRALLSRSGKVTDLRAQVALPFLKFLFDGTVEPISLRLMCLLRKQIIGDLIRNINHENTALFDLGSGWGRHALMFAKQYPDLKVFAGELSEGGQNITRWFSERFALPVETFGFDYLDWEDLVERAARCDRKELLFFSCHSIEQVTFNDVEMWKALLDLKKSVTFIHLEPVGWQFVSNAESSLSQPPDRAQGVHWGYNKNLVAIVDSLLSERRIRDLSVAPDYLAFGNTFNTGSLITFRNVPQQ